MWGVVLWLSLFCIGLLCLLVGFGGVGWLEGLFAFDSLVVFLDLMHLFSVIRSALTSVLRKECAHGFAVEFHVAVL